MDQGVDAIAAREIWTGYRQTLLGSESSLRGLYAGPLWHYFIAIGYFLSGGHPAGPVILLITLNILLTFIIIRKVSKEVSPKIGLLVGALLQISWMYYDSSRYAFNPFPNTFLGFLIIIFLADFLNGETRKYLLAAIPVGLFFHTDLAPAITINIFYFGLGLFALLTRRLKLRNLISAGLLVALFLLPHFASEFMTGFSQTHALIKEFSNPHGVFSNTQFTPLGEKMFLVISKGFYNQIPEIGFLGFVSAIILLIRRVRPRVNPFTKHFIILSTALLLISWLFFASNLGWRDWHTNFLSPLIFVSLLLALSALPISIFVPLILLTIFSHSRFFLTRYWQSVIPNDDPSILANEIRAIDWTYSQAKDKSLSVYVWIPSIYDYHFEYLFWWYGKNKNGYFPCELNTYPGAPKTYLPSGYEKYEKPRGNCPANTKVLIMEPDKNGQIDQIWYRDITEKSNLEGQTKIGKLRLEVYD